MRKTKTAFRGIWLDESLIKQNLKPAELLIYGYLYFKSDDDNKEILPALKALDAAAAKAATASSTQATSTKPR